MLGTGILPLATSLLTAVCTTLFAYKRKLGNSKYTLLDVTHMTLHMRFQCREGCYENWSFSFIQILKILLKDFLYILESITA